MKKRRSFDGLQSQKTDNLPPSPPVAAAGQYFHPAGSGLAAESRPFRRATKSPLRRQTAGGLICWLFLLLFCVLQPVVARNPPQFAPVVASVIFNRQRFPCGDGGHLFMEGLPEGGGQPRFIGNDDDVAEVVRHQDNGEKAAGQPVNSFPEDIVQLLPEEFFVILRRVAGFDQDNEAVPFGGVGFPKGGVALDEVLDGVRNGLAQAGLRDGFRGYLRGA